MEKNKHLTSDERHFIEDSLNHKMSYASIASALGKDPTTISKEVKTHSILRRDGCFGKNYNNCKHQYFCKRSALCDPCNSPQKHVYCKNCILCNQHCPDYEPIICSRRKKTSHVCNGCGFVYDCNYEKTFYKASKAQKEYKALLSESRSGIGFTEEELKSLDDKVSTLIRQGQSPHNVSVNNRDTIMVSKSTIYRLIDSGLISARNLDLPRKVRYKARKRKKSVFKVDRSCRVGRDYNCFQHYMDENPDTPVIQLDSVLGKKGGKVLLTVHFVNCEMMLAFLRDRNDAKSVENVFDFLYQALGHDRFCSIFRLLLADNGSEFSNPAHIEYTSGGIQRTRVFFCNPQAPYQKGSAERNHEFIRCFIPKGTDMGQYTQDDITLMMNHINSYSRVSLGNKCPYDVFRFLYGSDLLELLGCVTIPAQQVTLNKSVFRKGEAE
ncbi:MAG: IS30 family transposase [Oscillospiraceae bacterium]|nr:IS30 family transposase [Oscillospiraceae bacterium]